MGKHTIFVSSDWVKTSQPKASISSFIEALHMVGVIKTTVLVVFDEHNELVSVFRIEQGTVVEYTATPEKDNENA